MKLIVTGGAGFIGSVMVQPDFATYKCEMELLRLYFKVEICGFSSV